MMGKQWKFIPVKGFIALILFTLAFLVLWQAAYDSGGDPKDIRYQGWKLGICPMNLDRATDTVIGDVHRDNLVIGKTRDELVKKFGFVTTLDQASDYVRYCYTNSPYYGKDVLMLRRSNWMVLMKDSRAQSLLLVKGC